jgi:hypothetical protein
MKPLKDLPFTILFLSHLLCIVALSLSYGLHSIFRKSDQYIKIDTSGDSHSSTLPDHTNKFILGFILITIFSSSLSLLWVYLTSTMATQIVEFSLGTVVLVNVIGGIFLFVSGNSFSGLILLLVALSSLLFFLYVRSRVEFISANLMIACRAIWSMSSIIIWSIVVLVIQVRYLDRAQLVWRV